MRNKGKLKKGFLIYFSGTSFLGNSNIDRIIKGKKIVLKLFFKSFIFCVLNSVDSQSSRSYSSLDLRLHQNRMCYSGILGLIVKLDKRSGHIHSIKSLSHICTYNSGTWYTFQTLLNFQSSNKNQILFYFRPLNRKYVTSY